MKISVPVPENEKNRQKFSEENVENLFGGPRTETTFVKQSASRKKLRTAALYTFLLCIPRCNKFLISLASKLQSNTL